MVSTTDDEHTVDAQHIQCPATLTKLTLSLPDRRSLIPLATFSHLRTGAAMNRTDTGTQPTPA